MFKDSYIFLNTGCSIENHIKPTPYAIGTNNSPAILATSTIFVNSARIVLQIRHNDEISLTTSSSTIILAFIHQP